MYIYKFGEFWGMFRQWKMRSLGMKSCHLKNNRDLAGCDNLSAHLNKVTGRVLFSLNIESISPSELIEHLLVTNIS